MRSVCDNILLADQPCSEGQSTYSTIYIIEIIRSFHIFTELYKKISMVNLLLTNFRAVFLNTENLLKTGENLQSI